MNPPQVLLGAIEAGGTKFVCAVGSGPDDIRAQERFDTTLPAETIGRCLAFLQRFDGLAAVGIAAFGPLDLQAASSTYGFITSTPKAGWRNTDLAGAISRSLGLPVGIDTDVNGAALGEWHWGAARNLDNFLYLTVGTGIGGGAFVNGRVVHGLLHPEMGHIRVPHDLAADPFAGSTPAPLSQSSAVHICINAHRQSQRTANRASKIGVAPAGFGRRCDEAIGGRGRLQIKRTKRRDADGC